MASVDPSYRFLACQYLAEQLQVLMRESLGVRRNEEIEPVHQARVASRRVREALRMFADCFDAKKVSGWQKRVKKLTRELGAARDKDVQIEFLEGFLEGLEGRDRRRRPGVERLLLRWRQKREALQPEIVETLDRLDKAGTLVEMYGEVEKGLFILRSHQVQPGSPAVYERAAQHIRGGLDGLVTCGHSLEDPKDVQGHHQMRIAAKKLRYTLEICKPAYDGALGPFIDAAKRVQSLLGDLHDCDVWMADIDGFMEQERLATLQYFGHDRSFPRLKPGLLMLREDRKAHRRETFNEVLKYWKGLEEKGLRESLDTVLQAHVGASGKPLPGAAGEAV
jgi:CHAD domain-containing protein